MLVKDYQITLVIPNNYIVYLEHVREAVTELFLLAT